MHFIALDLLTVCLWVASITMLVHTARRQGPIRLWSVWFITMWVLGVGLLIVSVIFKMLALLGRGA